VKGSFLFYKYVGGLGSGILRPPGDWLPPIPGVVLLILNAPTPPPHVCHLELELGGRFLYFMDVPQMLSVMGYPNPLKGKFFNPTRSLGGLSPVCTVRFLFDKNPNVLHPNSGPFGLAGAGLGPNIPPCPMFLLGTWA